MVPTFKKRKKSENGGKKDFDQTSGGCITQGCITQKLVKIRNNDFKTLLYYKFSPGGWMLIAI